ncbi:energy transducer TonB [Luteimonas fraxinea]|uniref:energy transducer TonB n=1 Tax=Luteimonas fraxinea TaxID=2901869 RepID=UPI001E4B5607|nr:energy transducer TonB [Luteimonas fraxinea]MCD9126263.1 energy transducer TonB [Luteimonas fraxinea]
MKLQRVFGVLLSIVCLVPLIATAQSAREMRQQVEGSILVTGHVDIALDGSISDYALDQQGKLPEHVVGLIGRAMPALRFEPVLSEGVPVLARAKMSLRLVATPAADGNMTIAIKGASFGEEFSPDDTGRVQAIEMSPPRYPMNIAQIGGRGTVYLLVKVGRDGHVQDAAAEQTNLTALGSARQMDAIRRGLEKAALDKAKEWTFSPPTTGDAVSSDYWVVRVPVDFTLSESGRRPADSAYGQWVGYVPGAQTRPTWAMPDPPGFSPDALASGALHAGQSRFRLLTPLQG